MKLSDNIGFTYDLARVSDANWGTVQNGKWNGLISELINRKVDLALASLVILQN
jgi:ionotropic glutamate receptor NMDA 2B